MSLTPSTRKALHFEASRKKLLAARKHRQVLRTYQTQRHFLPDENTGHFWDDIFAEKPAIFPMENWRINLVARLLDPQKSVLNLGVGRGSLEELLLQKFSTWQYLGTDITPKTIAHLRAQFPTLTFKQTDLLGLSPKQNQFDQILLLEVLEHIKPSETFSVLRQVYHLLKPGGRFYVSVPVNEGLDQMLPINPNSHMRLYSRELLSFELQTVGFAIQQIYQASAFSTYFGLKHLVNLLFHWREPNNLLIVCEKPLDTLAVNR